VQLESGAETHFVEICQNVVSPDRQNKENEVVEIVQRLVQMPKKKALI